MNNGFDRLRGAAAASVMGLGSLLAGSGRAATTGFNFKLTYNSSIAWGGAITAPSGILPFQNGVLGNTGRYVQGLGNLCNVGVTSTTGGFLLQGASVSVFCLRDAGLFNVTALTTASASAATTSTAFLGDAFDGVMRWAIDGFIYQNPVLTTDLNNVVVGGTVTSIVPGINAQASFRFSPDYAVVRTIMTLTNTTGIAKPVTATVLGNLGSDSQTVVQATSDGDTINDDTDMWVVTSDTPQGVDAYNRINNNEGDPVITTTRYGVGGLMPTVGPQFRLGDDISDDRYMYHYDVTVPANSSVSLMIFHEMTTTISTASSFANDYESLVGANGAGFLDDLSDADLLKIVNYGDAAALVGAGGGTTPASGRNSLTSSTSSSSSGALNPLGLASLAGLAGLFRLKRKQRG